MHDHILITKASGEKEPFAPEKLRASLRRAKAKPATIEKIIRHVELEIKEGITTTKLYRHAFELLKKEEKPASARYSLRGAVMDLGPTGFPFEQLVAEIFRTKGFETITDVEMLGGCVPHEIDVVAWNKDRLVIVEAKFHNETAIKSDLKVALYIKARFDDLKDTLFNYGHSRKIDESWLVTNTKFSTQAIHYAECKNMKLVGWNYPTDGSLEDLIVDSGLHPITCLESISKMEKGKLLATGIIHLKQAKENQDILKQAGLDENKIKEMLEEIKLIQN